MRTPTRRQELAVAATIAVIATVAVVVAKSLAGPPLAIFAAGVGSAAVVAYVVVANRLISAARRRG